MAFAHARQVLLTVHEASGTPVDVSLAWLSFEDEALRACRSCDYAGVRIRIPRPEDLLIYKLIASRSDHSERSRLRRSRRSFHGRDVTGIAAPFYETPGSS